MKEAKENKVVKKRVYGLDILRAVAILSVVLGHGNLLLPPKLSQAISCFLVDGVAIFFVLSGFLIGGILIRLLEKEGASAHGVLNFWIRRWFRTLPNYFLILSVLALLSFFFLKDFSPAGHFRYLIFSQNLFYAHPPFFPEAWSICIEEWFYLVIPLMLFLLVKGGRLPVRQSIVIAAGSILIFSTMFRIQRYYSMDIRDLALWDMMLRKQVVTQLDSLMYGVIGAFLSFYHKGVWVRYKRALFMGGLLVFGVAKWIAVRAVFGPQPYEPGLYFSVFLFSTTSLGTLCFLPLLSEMTLGRGMIFRGVTFISLISYSMYLVNLSLVQVWGLERVDLSVLSSISPHMATGARYVLYWILTIGISALLYRHFEVPMMNLREKFKIRGGSAKKPARGESGLILSESEENRMGA